MDKMDYCIFEENINIFDYFFEILEDIVISS